MLRWKSSSIQRVWCAKQLIFLLYACKTVCRVKHWILPDYGRVIFIYTYILILLPGHGRGSGGYSIAAMIVILDDTILYCIFVFFVANHCNGLMHVWQARAELCSTSSISRCVSFSLPAVGVSAHALQVISNAPKLYELPRWRYEQKASSTHLRAGLATRGTFWEKKKLHERF